LTVFRYELRLAVEAGACLLEPNLAGVFGIVDAAEKLRAPTVVTGPEGGFFELIIALKELREAMGDTPVRLGGTFLNAP
jgi:hypothetical protein